MKTDYIVTISGNDILSGGGLYADLATYIRYDLQAFVAVTCLTTRSEEGFSLFPVAKEIFRDQLNSFTNAPISAIKIGLLPNAEMCEIVLDFIKGHLGIPVVLDPVLACKEIDDVKIVPLRQEILQLLPYVTVVTPNLVEAQLLSQKEIVSLKDMQEAAKYFYQLGAKQVVIVVIDLVRKKLLIFFMMVKRLLPWNVLYLRKIILAQAVLLHLVSLVS